MSISVEQAEQYKNEVAVLCCRAEKGTVIQADNLEDPMIIPELADTGLVDLTDDTAKVGEVIGATLLKTVDSLTPLTPDLLEGMTVIEEEVEEEPEEAEEQVVEEAEEVQAEEVMVQQVPGGPIRIKIAEGKGIDIELKL